jgi:phage-related minor tail protein
MADKARNVVLNFKMDGQVQYAQTLKQINMVMNTAAKEYKNHIVAMGKDASATDKLAAEKKKLEIQMEGAAKRTAMLRAEYEAMSKDTNTTAEQLNRMYGRLLDAERAETSLGDAMKRVNDGLSDQALEAREAKVELNKLQDGTKLLEAEQKSLTSSFKLQKAELGANADESDKLELAQKQLQQQMEMTNRIVNNLEQQLDQSKRAYGENSVEVRQLEAKLNDAKSSVKNFENSLEKMGASADDAGDDMQELNKKMDLNNLMEAGEILQGISDKLIEIGKMAMEVSKEFAKSQKQMKLSLGLTEEEASKLSKVAQEVWKNGFGSELSEATDAVGQLYGLLGDTPDAELQHLSQGVLRLSEVFGLDVTEAMTGAASLMRNFGMDGEESLNYITFALQRTTGQFRTDFVDALTELNPTFKGMGASADEAFEMMIAAQESGMENFDALSSLTQGFTDNVSAGGEDIQDVFKSLGGNANKTFKEFEKGGATAYDVFVATAQQLGEMDDKTQLNKLGAEIFGDVWTEAGADAITSLGFVNGKIGETNGKLDEMAEKNPGGNLEASFRDLQAKFEPIGKKITESLTPVIDGLGKLFDAFSKLSGADQTFLVVLGSLMAIAIILIPIIAALAVSFGALQISLLPVIMGIAGLAAVITGIILVIQNWGNITDWLSEKWTEFSSWFGELWSNLVTACEEGWSATVEYFSQAWSDFITMMHEFFAPIGQFFSDLWSGIVETASEWWGNLVETATNFWSQLTLAWEATWSTIMTVLDPIISLITTLLEGAWLTITAGAQIAWLAFKEYIVNPVSEAFDWVSGKIGELGTWLSEQWEAIKLAAQLAWSLFKQYIIDPITEVYNWVKGKIGEMVNWINEKWSAVKSATERAWSAVKEHIIQPISNAYNSVVEKVTSMYNSMVEKFDSIKNSAKEKFEAAKNFIVDPIKSAVETVGEWIDKIKSFFSDLVLKIPTPEMPKLPHFSLETNTKSFFGKEITYPTGIDVEWRAKGAIFTRPTIFGANGGKLQGAGETGPEAVLPLNAKTLGDIGRGIAAHMPQSDNNRPIILQVDGKTFAQITGDYTDAEGGTRIRRIQRGLA